MAGAFQTSRDIFSSPIWKNIVEFRLFFLIYGNAVFSEEGYRVTDDLILQRGQWLRSTRKLQDDLEYIENRQVKRYSTSVINRCIKSLVASQRVCTKTHELGTVFTVVNYQMYQGFDNYKNNNLERNLEQYQNSVGTIEEQHRNNNKNVNNVMNEINNNSTTTTDDTNVFKLYESEKFGFITPRIAEEIGALIDEYSDEFVKRAIVEASISGIRTIPYVKGILRDWKSTNHPEPWLLERSRPQSKQPSNVTHLKRYGGRPGKQSLPVVAPNVDVKPLSQEERDSMRARAMMLDGIK